MYCIDDNIIKVITMCICTIRNGNPTFKLEPRDSHMRLNVRCRSSFNFVIDIEYFVVYVFPFFYENPEIRTFPVYS